MIMLNSLILVLMKSASVTVDNGDQTNRVSLPEWRL